MLGSSKTMFIFPIIEQVRVINCKHQKTVPANLNIKKSSEVYILKYKIKRKLGFRISHWNLEMRGSWGHSQCQSVNDGEGPLGHKLLLLLDSSFHDAAKIKSQRPTGGIWVVDCRLWDLLGDGERNYLISLVFSFPPR